MGRDDHSLLDRSLNESPAPSHGEGPDATAYSASDERPTNGEGTKLSGEWSKDDNSYESVAASPGSDPDLALVDQCRTGDRQAFNMLVLYHKDRLFTLAVRLLGDHGEAEDATQNVFLRAYEKITEFRGEAKFSTWLYRICY